MNATWYLIGAIFLVGLWGVIAEGNIIKKIIALSISNSAIIMLFIFFGSRSGNTAPILTGPLAADAAADGVATTNGGTAIVPPVPVDPIPQALTLTAIVVGICVVALALVLAYRLYQRYGTLDATELENLVWKRDE
jgi:multicomponent Na+:H+ antiporter subunit C